MDQDAPPGTPAGEARVRTWHLQVAYDGTDFHGWQVQPDRRTVQGELQHRLRLLLHQPGLRITGTSRTDAGVHALDQHVSFACPTPEAFDAARLRYVLNRWLPADVRVLAVEEVPADFSARFSVHGKAYIYCIDPAGVAGPLFRHFAWSTGRPVDVAAMRAAASALVGEHDFTSFAANPGRELPSTVRHVQRIAIAEVGGLVCITVVGVSFLYRMVRGISGFLNHVGTGRAAPEDAARVLAARDRQAAADSAPPQGLFLARVFFDPAVMAAYEPVLPPFAWPAAGGLACHPDGPRDGLPGGNA